MSVSGNAMELPLAEWQALVGSHRERGDRDAVHGTRQAFAQGVQPQALELRAKGREAGLPAALLAEVQHLGAFNGPVFDDEAQGDVCSP